MGSESPDYGSVFTAGGGGGELVGAGGSFVSLGGGIQIGDPNAGGPCQPAPVTEPVFLKQMFTSAQAARRELYSWTTDEQVAELRKDKLLFTTTETAGLGPGFAFTYLQQLASDQTDPERAQLAGILAGDLFSKKRYAWPEPWATRMGWPGEDYGSNLLRIVLKPRAWLALIVGGQIIVVDQDNAPVTPAAAIANPERLGAIFYWKDGALGGGQCGGSFANGGNGYREFILGNPAMVEEWSLATPQIRERLVANIDQLTRLLTQIRSCPTTSGAASWNLSVTCAWDMPGLAPFSDLTAYEQALAIPSENYLPVPARIAAMIETLEGDLFEPDPLVVTPGSP